MFRWLCHFHLIYPLICVRLSILYFVAFPVWVYPHIRCNISMGKKSVHGAGQQMAAKFQPPLVFISFALQHCSYHNCTDALWGLTLTVVITWTDTHLWAAVRARSAQGLCRSHSEGKQIPLHSSPSHPFLIRAICIASVQQVCVCDGWRSLCCVYVFMVLCMARTEYTS